MATATRKMFVGFGEHIGALLVLGDSYTDDEYIEAIEAAREAGVGEAYADKMLGTDIDALIRGVEQDSGERIVEAAERRLRSRGVDPKKANYAELAAALEEVSP